MLRCSEVVCESFRGSGDQDIKDSLGDDRWPNQNCCTNKLGLFAYTEATQCQLRNTVQNKWRRDTRSSCGTEYSCYFWKLTLFYIRVTYFLKEIL